MIFIEAVRSVWAAEPHQRPVFGILAFGGAEDDALVDVEVLDVYKRQGKHEGEESGSRTSEKADC